MLLKVQSILLCAPSSAFALILRCYTSSCVHFILIKECGQSYYFIYFLLNYVKFAYFALFVSHTDCSKAKVEIGSIYQIQWQRKGHATEILFLIANLIKKSQIGYRNCVYHRKYNLFVNCIIC